MLKKANLKFKILLYFTFIIVVIFVLMWGMFHLATSRYISVKAKTELAAANKLVKGTMLRNEAADIEKLRQNLKTQLRGISTVSRFFGDTGFIVLSDKRGAVLYPGSSSAADGESKKAAELLNSIEDEYPDYKFDRLYLITTDDSEYYFSASKLNSGRYIILFYMDISSFKYFVKMVDIILIIVFMLGGLLSVACSLWISSRITKPVQALCSYAKDVSRGSFEAREFGFHDREFAQLAGDMNKMAQKLSEYDEEQKKFFQNISHDLRTPLMSIQGYAEGIFHDVFKQPQQIAAIIADESKRLTEMVNDLLFLTKLNNRNVSLKKEQINLVSLLKDVITTSEVIAAKGNKNISFDTEAESIFLKGDEQCLYRAFLNLVSNCVRHADKNVNVILKKECTTVIINDDGEGFTAEDLESVFKRGYKGIKGEYGIGLLITKSIFDQHNITVTPANRKDSKGAEFICEFCIEDSPLYL